MFETELATAIDGNDSPEAQAVAKILAAPDSLRKRIAINILKHRAALWLHDNRPELVNFQNYGSVISVNWSAVPWAEILVGLLKVLVLILPFIL